ncbi:MAG: halocarboxylic acid dehydrogenase DehI family protein [Casimicrobiaceae bacterium]
MVAPASPKFPQVEHHEAAGDLKATFDDIEATLRVAWVAFACRIISGFPGALPRLWQAAKPHFATRYTERAADALRANALLPRGRMDDPRRKLKASGWTDDKIRELLVTLDAFNYGNVKYLLLITAWSEALQGRDAEGAPMSAADARPIPRGLPDGVAPMHHMVEENQASPEVIALYDRVKRMHFHHGPSSDYRLLANYPDYLTLALDDVIGPVVRTPAYESKTAALVAEARDWVRDFPAPAGVGPSDLAPACKPHEIAGLVGILFMSQRFIADITLDILRMKQAFDGDDAAARSPFPVLGS